MATARACTGARRRSVWLLLPSSREGRGRAFGGCLGGGAQRVCFGWRAEHKECGVSSLCVELVCRGMAQGVAPAAEH